MRKIKFTQSPATAAATSSSSSKTRYLCEGMGVTIEYGEESVKSSKLYGWIEKERILKRRELSDIFDFLRWVMEEVRMRQWNEPTTLIWIQYHLEAGVFAAARRATNMQGVLRAICVGVVTGDNLTKYRQSVFALRQKKGESAFNYFDRLLSSVAGFGDDLGITQKDIMSHFSCSLRREWVQCNQFLYAEVKSARDAGISPSGMLELIATNQEAPVEHKEWPIDRKETPPSRRVASKETPASTRVTSEKTVRSDRRGRCFDCGASGERRGHKGCPGPSCYDYAKPGVKRGHDGCSKKRVVRKSRRTGTRVSPYELLLPTPTGFLECVWDTGATAHMMPESVAQELGCIISPMDGETRMANGVSERILGRTNVDVCIGPERVRIQFQVVSNLQEVLISPDCWRGPYKDEQGEDGYKYLTIHSVPFAFDSTTKRWSPTSFLFNGSDMDDAIVAELEEKLVEDEEPICDDQVVLQGSDWVQQQSETVQDEIGAVMMELKKSENWILEVPEDRGVFAFEIVLEPPGARFVDPRRPLYGQRKALARQTVQEWLEIGLVEKILAKDAQCISNLTFPPKPGGGVRVCLDAVHLNRLTVIDPGAVDDVESVFRDMNHQANLFAVLDLKWGFYHLEIRAEDRPKAAFWGPDGCVYSFKRMAFGFVNAPVTFRDGCLTY